MGMASYTFLIDFDGDGDFDLAVENVTSYQMADGVTISMGRDRARSTAATKTGTADYSLDNTDRRFSPENASSPVPGDVLRARAAYIGATLLGTTYGLYRGVTDEMTPVYGRKLTVDVSCVDGLASLNRGQLSLPLYSGLRTGDAMNVILDAIGWTGGRDIDPGQTMLPWFWAEGDVPLAVIQKLIDGEGLPSYAGCDGNGNFVFRDRGHRDIRSGSTSVQATWNYTGTEPRFSLPVTYDHGLREIVNQVILDVGIRRPSSQLVTVWEQTEAGISLADTESTVINVVASDPFYGAVTPTAAVDTSDDNAIVPDIALDFGAVNVSLSRTSGASTQITITATGGPAQINRLRLRARSVPVQVTKRVELENTASQSKYGVRGVNDGAVTLNPDYASFWDVQAVAALLLAYRAERLPTLQVPFEGGTVAILREQLSRNISDRVRINYPTADISNRDAFVETITHTITGRGSDRKHVTTFGIELAPQPVTNPFILGTSLLGGTDLLAPDGFIAPSTLMILGTGLLGTAVLGY